MAQLTLVYLLIAILFALPASVHAEREQTTSRTTINLIRSLATAGRAEAQYALGQLYLNGNGVEQDYATAMDWFYKAAEQNHADAQNSLGMMYANGLGVSVDCDRAMQLFSHVRESSHIYTLAQANLAWLLATCPQDMHRDGYRALKITRHLLQHHQGNQASLLDTLAAAYAETGQFQLAIETQQQAIALVSGSASDAARLERFNRRLAAYQAHQPWRSSGN